MERQRIVFRGRKLNDHEVVSQLGLEDGFVLHLIASLEAAQPPRDPQPERAAPSQPQPEAMQDNEEPLGDAAENEIFAGILRTLSSLA